MRKFYYLVIALFVSLTVNAQVWEVNISEEVQPAYTAEFEGHLVIDVATAASSVLSANIVFNNPFKGETFSVAEVSFDVYNYYGVDSIKVLGSLIAFYDTQLGRMYFSNGSYLGYNTGASGGGWIDANLIQYGLGTDFIGGNIWKNVKLRFSPTGYAMYVDNTLAYDQSSTDVTINGSTPADQFNYNEVMDFLKAADTLVIGTGSWWSDNTRPDGTYWDNQFSYLKNIKLTQDPYPVSVKDQMMKDPNRELIREEYFNISGQKTETDYNDLGPGIYIKRSVYSNGAIESTKIVKARRY